MTTDGKADHEPLPQLTRSDIKTMTPDQIHEARAAGRFSDLLGAKSAVPPAVLPAGAFPQLSRRDLAGLDHEAIQLARSRGQLHDLLAPKSKGTR